MQFTAQRNLSNQRDSASWDSDPVGLLEIERDMRRIYGALGLFRQFGEQPADKIVSGVAFGVSNLKKLLPNLAAVIDVDEAGMSHSLGHALSFGIKDLVAADDSRLSIGEERKRDMLPVGEFFEDCFRVVADRGKTDASGFKSVLRLLQLHELRFAIRSPVCRTEEEQYETILALDRLKRLFIPELVASAE